MKTSQRSKTFDCIEYKRQVQEEIYNDIKDLTPEEQLAYIRRRAESGPLAGWWQDLKSSHSAGNRSEEQGQ